MKLKKIIPAILLLFVGIIFAGIRKETVVSPDKRMFSPSPTVLSQQETPEPTPVTQSPNAAQKKGEKRTDNSRKALINFDTVYIQVLQADGTEDKYHVCNDRIPEDYVDGMIRSTNWVYYCLSSGMTLYRIPIQQEGDKIKLLPKDTETLGTIDSTYFIYATDQYVICKEDTCLVWLNVKTREQKKLPIPHEDTLYWDFITDYNEKLIIDKESNLYGSEINTETGRRTFYKISVDTFQKSELSNRTNAILLDPSGEVVIMEMDKTWNYVYYPKTGKRYRCGRNMFSKWKKSKKNGEFFKNDTVGSRTSTNRDLADWIREKNPWSYQKKRGSFDCANQFIYKDRMYVKVDFEWTEPKDIDEDDDFYSTHTLATMLFSYSLKNYKGIRPEKQINKMMRKTSESTYVGDEEEGTFRETGDFALLWGDFLVFEHEGDDDEYDDEFDDDYDRVSHHYVLYNLRTGKHRNVTENMKDYKYLLWLDSWWIK